MIKIFNQTEAFPGKVNFVDDRGVMLGYDMEQGCCEDASWNISALDLAETEDKGITDIPYHFDPEFFEAIEDGAQYDEGGAAKFRLLPDAGGEPVYLVLSNSHNGYYGHGFRMTQGDKMINEGCL
jgi:hypothetical protein